MFTSVGSVSSKHHAGSVSVVSAMSNDGSMFDSSNISGSGKKSQRRGAPKNALPPLPWHLNEYEQHSQGSSFVRNIGQKAFETTTMFEHEKRINEARMKEKQRMSQDGSDIETDWNSFVYNQGYYRDSKSSGAISAGVLPPISEQDQSQQMSNRKIKKPTKKFDSNRLMHPWQVS